MNNITINYKIILREILIWFLAAIAALAVFFPIYSQISYKYLTFQLIIFVLGIQFFRWIVFFKNNILFSNSYVKFFSMLTLFVYAFAVWDRLQAVVLVLEDQDLSQIANGIHTTQGYMSLPQIYTFFNYLIQTVLFGGYTSVALAIGLSLRILASYLGWGSYRMKEYIQTSSTIEKIKNND